jgi:hypothetical protein
MSSSSLLPNKYFDKLLVNKLQAVSSKIKNQDTESYLYSLDIQNGDWNGNKLKFFKTGLDLLTFSDRPFRYQEQVSGLSAEQQLDILFTENTNNSFTEDPPNAVLVTNTGQEAFEITKLTVNNGEITMDLNALKNEGVLTPTTGKMSLFIDNSTSTDIYCVQITKTGGTINIVNKGAPTTDYKNGPPVAGGGQRPNDPFDTTPVDTTNTEYLGPQTIAWIPLTNVGRGIFTGSFVNWPNIWSTFGTKYGIIYDSQNKKFSITLSDGFQELSVLNNTLISVNNLEFSIIKSSALSYAEYATTIYKGTMAVAVLVDSYNGDQVSINLPKNLNNALSAANKFATISGPYVVYTILPSTEYYSRRLNFGNFEKRGIERGQKMR